MCNAAVATHRKIQFSSNNVLPIFFRNFCFNSRNTRKTTAQQHRKLLFLYPLPQPSSPKLKELVLSQDLNPLCSGTGTYSTAWPNSKGTGIWALKENQLMHLNIQMGKLKKGFWLLEHSFFSGLPLGLNNAVSHFADEVVSLLMSIIHARRQQT